MKFRLIATVPLALLAACGGSGGADGDERKTAAGEVLGGSISDAMLPLDTVTSQSPPLESSPDPVDDPAGDESSAPPADSGEGPGEPPREPAPSPAPPATDEPTAE